MAKLSPVFNGQVFDDNGDPAAGWQIETYAAGSSTPQATYTTATGDVPQANPIILNALGFPDNPIHLTEGLNYKLTLKDENGVVKGPPFDNIAGVNDASIDVSQWIASGTTPTYVSASSYTVAGDQTTEFHVGRRQQFTVTAGTVYGTIASTAYNGSSLTTVTMTMDSAQALDSGLSAVNHSILRADRSAVPLTENLGYLRKAGGTMSGAINEARATVASHATAADIWGASGNTIDFTGSETITDFPDAPQAGAKRRLICASTPTFTDNANIDVQGDATYTAAAGDVIDVEAVTASTFKVMIQKKNGKPVTYPDQLATSSGAAPSYSVRAWVNFSASGSVAAVGSGNVSSITDNGVGDFTINFTAAMPNANYAVGFITNEAYTPGEVSAANTTSVRVRVRDAEGTKTLKDLSYNCFHIIG